MQEYFNASKQSPDEVLEEESWGFPKFNAAANLEGRKVLLRDITLREGEQTADVSFSRTDKIKLATALSDAGVHQIQCGYSPADGEIVNELKRSHCKALLEIVTIGFVPNWEEQITAAAESDADIINIIFRSDDLHLADLGLSRDEAKKKVGTIVSHAKSLGANRISFSPSFATRADPHFLVQLIKTAIENGASHILLPDSSGVANPQGFAAMIQFVKAKCNIEIGVHCHNDFGLALTNSIEGVIAGASVIECSIGGFGERAGNAALEEVVMALKFLYGIDLQIDLEKLVSVANAAFRTARIPIPPTKPILGSNTFTQKLDIHVMTTRKRPWLHEPFDPKLIGMNRRVVLGKLSGPIAVREKSKELSLQIPEEQIGAVVIKVNEFADLHKRCLTDDEFVKLAKTVSESTATSFVDRRPASAG